MSEYTGSEDSYLDHRLYHRVLRQVSHMQRATDRKLKTACRELGVDEIKTPAYSCTSSDIMSLDPPSPPAKQIPNFNCCC